MAGVVSLHCLVRYSARDKSLLGSIAAVNFVAEPVEKRKMIAV